MNELNLQLNKLGNKSKSKVIKKKKRKYKLIYRKEKQQR